MSAKELQLKRLYAKVPRIACRGLCADSCGPIKASKLEVQRLEKAGGSPLSHDPETLHCSMLENGRCRAYEARPLICRLWGVVRGMPCVFGCVPERMLENVEGFALLERALQIGGET